MPARHPTPDPNSVAAAERALKTVGAASAHDLVVVLLSGGASALWAAPVAGLDLAAGELPIERHRLILAALREQNASAGVADERGDHQLARSS